MSRAALGVLLLLAGGALRPALGQVSPGPLARGHRELEGTLKCTSCHAGGKEAMRTRCIACHRDVGWLADRQRGFHGSPAVRGERCASCHPDHAGVDFALIKWPDGSSDRFDHRRAGWPLEQSHATAACADCHAPKYRVPEPGRLAVGGRSRWTGLTPACAACHEDPHRSALGGTCTSCHDAGRWSATPGFGHDTTDYPLTGRHTGVSCDGCHLADRLAPKRDAAGRPVPVYRPVPHGSCASCHRDAHAGSLGPECATCHTTRGFREITGDGFDHGRTRYPLLGRHRSVRCGACHRDFSSDAGRRPAAGTCSACHADAHAGQAALAGRPADCAACHSERGFDPATFTVAQHVSSRYPLEDRHRDVRCGQCHRRDGSTAGRATWGTSRVVLRPRFAACGDCHEDRHGGQLAPRPDRGECAACHGTAGWTPSTFEGAAHAAAGFPLEGRHAAIACQACHGLERPGLGPTPHAAGAGPARLVLRGIERECVGCHVDPHAGRFEREGARPAAQGCPTCHDANAFSPSRVNVETHGRLGFALEGAHRATPCQACHPELDAPALPPPTSSLLKAGGRLRTLRFEASRTCADCHRTVHGPQFDDRPDRGACGSCHGETAFAPASRFDHDRDTRFPLAGGHGRATCAACHRSDPARGGTAGVVYRPLSDRCESCHTGARSPR